MDKKVKNLAKSGQNRLFEFFDFRQKMGFFLLLSSPETKIRKEKNYVDLDLSKIYVCIFSAAHVVSYGLKVLPTDRHYD